MGSPELQELSILSSEYSRYVDTFRLLRQQGIATPTPISLDKHCVFAPTFTCKKHVLVCLSNHVLSVKPRLHIHGFLHDSPRFTPISHGQKNRGGPG